jgi:hypothetical protein
VGDQERKIMPVRSIPATTDLQKKPCKLQRDIKKSGFWCYKTGTGLNEPYIKM